MPPHEDPRAVPRPSVAAEPPSDGGAAPDDGLQRLLKWTFIMLVVTLLIAVGMVQLVMYLFDRPA